MTALLALELSPNPCTLAVQKECGAMHSREFSGERGRALLHEIDQLLQQAETPRTSLAGVVVGIGPGSYTGLRIACTAARTLSYALQIPCGGVGSFAAAIARHASEQNALNQEVHIVLDAYRGEYYHGAGQFDGKQVSLTVEPRVIAREDLPVLGSEPALLCDARLDEALAQYTPARYFPHAEQTLALARQAGVDFQGRGFEALHAPEPLYLRAAAFRS